MPDPSIATRVSPEVLQRIDAARGTDRTRSDWLAEAILNQLEREGQDPRGTKKARKPVNSEAAVNRDHTVECPATALKGLPYGTLCDADKGGCEQMISADFSHQVSDLDPDGSKRRWLEQQKAKGGK